MMTPDPYDDHDPAAWPLAPAAHAACDRIAEHLTYLGWRPLPAPYQATYPPSRVAAYADPTARARLELRPDPAAPGQAHVTLLRLHWPDIDKQQAGCAFTLAFTGPRLNTDAVMRAAALAVTPRPQQCDPIELAVREHGWQRTVGGGQQDQRAVSPDPRRALSYTASSESTPWHGEAAARDGAPAWQLAATEGTPGQVLATALLDTRPARTLTPAPLRRLHNVMAAHSFTAHPWQQQVTITTLLHAQLADLYLREDGDGGVIALTATTPHDGADPEIEVAAYPQGTAVHTMLGADRHHYTHRGTARFDPGVPIDAILAYLGTLAFAPGDGGGAYGPSNPNRARAAAETYAALSAYRPDQRDLHNPAALADVVSDLIIDLLHYAETAGIPDDPRDLVERALSNYLDERAEPEHDAFTQHTPDAEPGTARTAAHP